MTFHNYVLEAMAKAICKAMGDDWERESPDDLFEAYGPLANCALNALLAILPEIGWRIVPVEAIPAMITAAIDRPATREPSMYESMYASIYRAMLSAAPDPLAALTEGKRDE